MSYDVTRKAKLTASNDSTSTFVIDDSTSNLASQASRLFTKALNNRMSTFGVSAGQWPLLLHLWEQDGLSQKDLSRRVGIEAPTTTNTIKRMERDGFIQRNRNSRDRREIKVHLTDKGHELRDDLLPFVQEVNALATHGMTPQDKTRLNGLLSYMIARLS